VLRRGMGMRFPIARGVGVVFRFRFWKVVTLDGMVMFSFLFLFFFFFGRGD
jgi:hypothetical protein